jgi:hypothetical protein
MSDPTREEMLEFLANKRGAEKFSEFDRDREEEAIYWYAHDCHHGQGSNLFSALAWCRFHPGPIPVGPVSEKARKLYQALEREFGHSHEHQQERERKKRELEQEQRKRELEQGRKKRQLERGWEREM